VNPTIESYAAGLGSLKPEPDMGLFSQLTVIDDRAG